MSTIAKRNFILNTNVHAWRFDLKYAHPGLIPGTLNSIIGEDMKTMTCSGEEEYWCGPTEGEQLVHQIVCDKEMIENNAPDYRIYHTITEQGKLWVQKVLPEAIHRMGCVCCYNDGPDLSIRIDTITDPTKVIIDYYVDFDFKKEDHD